ncbi:CDP-glycerol glycerophosphotransferase (TagB/SpsB family) [Brevibacterium sanguinis]|uniref:CDP-glycerol glycerophosphotransferase (TagB/SpsB family) n=2 Tax=Brevibacterium TaxID=1696 RepID=A0A366IGR0_9MICO|nr:MULTISPECIES: CDP-glycerol glycerophosphotransferase family protein [Brevibacterium]RBP62944.1 CDP-glycerol glycerophosphotransferase (TagB/SpsB family) [Brevibacterium sanguinis]RBP69511.1 CDP-glycerol glycerophosphotransferase (TagB/SpsB family) [Brevibacterium celere]
MAVQEHLLTVVIEATEPLDRESTTYRRLMSARLLWESDFTIRVVEEPLTTARLTELCASVDSKYILFIRQTHQVSPAFLPTVLKFLSTKTVYLAEPYKYTGNIPKQIASTSIDRNYHYTRDTDIYGVAFNVGRLGDVLDAIGDVDRTGVYLAYRLYWSINSVTPLEEGYSVSSNTSTAIGISPRPEVSRLVPLIPTASSSMRLHLLRLLVLFLRGLRETERTDITLDHLRGLVSTFGLTKDLDLAEHMHAFECAWIRWLDRPDMNAHLFKQLSGQDAYLVFDDAPHDHGDDSAAQNHLVEGPDVILHRVELGDETMTVTKSYLPRDLRPELESPDHYDFYRRPITEDSVILFFDRPMQADDNAEHLYAHFTAEHPEFAQAYFALNPKSPDWDRLSARGFKLVSIFTPEFYELFLRSDLVVSSQIFNLRHQGKTLANSRFVYLQHGVQLNDMSNWVASKFFDVFVATGKVEADYLRTVAPVETLNSGLPRLQTLRRDSEGSRDLLFMPTWRFNLHQASPEHFRSSQYFRAINSVLTDRELLGHLERTDRTLHVKLHPNIEKRAAQFSFSRRVVRSELSYREAISMAEFVFTDYSSAVLDAAFVGIPIAYYQWDADDFFHEQPYESRLDYHSEGLGPVFTAHAELIEHVTSERYSQPDPEFARRSARFFEGVNTDRINETIIERMLSL